MATRRLSYAIVVLFVVVLAVSSAGLLYSVSQGHVNYCQRQVNARFQSVDIIRAQAAKASGQASVRLWSEFLDLATRKTGSQAQKLAEFISDLDTYRAEIAKVTDTQYPVRTGNQACGG